MIAKQGNTIEATYWGQSLTVRGRWIELSSGYAALEFIVGMPIRLATVAEMDEENSKVVLPYGCAVYGDS